MFTGIFNLAPAELASQSCFILSGVLKVADRHMPCLQSRYCIYIVLLYKLKWCS